MNRQIALLLKGFDGARIDLTGVPGFRADGPPANDWRPDRPFPVLKIAGAFVMFAGAVAGVCVFFWMVIG
jgi:hypothetical protein